MRKKIAIFGGSFDPIHFGHINLALSLKEKKKLDEVIFVVANISPYKKDVINKTDPRHRLKMVKLAIDGIDGFSVSDYEIKKGGITYTIDTIMHFSKLYKDLDIAHPDVEHPDVELYFILAGDTLKSFDSWKRAKDILKYASPLVGLRYPDLLEKDLLNDVSSNEILKKLKNGIVETSIFEISSTKVKDRLKKEKHVLHMIEKEVLYYIKEHDLY
jgi:nicotinate-nucleotide adenylyltransferase